MSYRTKAKLKAEGLRLREEEKKRERENIGEIPGTEELKEQGGMDEAALVVSHSGLQASVTMLMNSFELMLDRKFEEHQGSSKGNTESFEKAVEIVIDRKLGEAMRLVSNGLDSMFVQGTVQEEVHKEAREEEVLQDSIEDSEEIIKEMEEVTAETEVIIEEPVEIVEEMKAIVEEEPVMSATEAREELRREILEELREDSEKQAARATKKTADPIAVKSKKEKSKKEKNKKEKRKKEFQGELNLEEGELKPVKRTPWSKLTKSEARELLFNLMEEAEAMGVDITTPQDFKNLGGRFNTAYQKAIPIIFGAAPSGRARGRWKIVLEEYSNL